MGRGATYDGVVRARANTGAAGYRGKQAAFRGKRGVFPGGYRARGTTGGAGGYLCRSGAYTGGAATPAGGAAAQPTPGGAATRRLHLRRRSLFSGDL